MCLLLPALLFPWSEAETERPLAFPAGHGQLLSHQSSSLMSDQKQTMQLTSKKPLKDCCCSLFKAREGEKNFLPKLTKNQASQAKTPDHPAPWTPGERDSEKAQQRAQRLPAPHRPTLKKHQPIFGHKADDQRIDYSSKNHLKTHTEPEAGMQ